ncbi:hypothetical protein [Massilia consociata]|uniref:N-acetylmuramoyl-L-alanine amidase n=1 Tax=Massilia consociata TaxID=760117 RepID=A0ABV6FDK3_9BURK
MHHQGEPFKPDTDPQAYLRRMQTWSRTAKGWLDIVEPNQLQLDAVVNLMALLAAKYKVPLDDIKSHRDHSDKTVCPGANLYRYMQEDYFRHKVALRLAGEQARAAR